MKLSELLKMHKAGMMQVKRTIDDEYIVAHKSHTPMTVDTYTMDVLLEKFGYTNHCIPANECTDHLNKFLNAVEKGNMPPEYIQSTEVTFQQSKACESDKSIWRTHIITHGKPVEYTIIEGKPGLGGRVNILNSSDGYVKPVSFKTLSLALIYLTEQYEFNPDDDWGGAEDENDVAMLINDEQYEEEI